VSPATQQKRHHPSGRCHNPMAKLCYQNTTASTVNNRGGGLLISGK
jgi:hypothetical protein